MPMVTGSPKDLRCLALAGGAFLALACGHTDPFTTSPPTSNLPFEPTPPVRLTFNDGADRYPSWLPDGSGILYSSQQLSRPDRDLCLAELPPGGGSQRRLVCDLTRLGRDTTNTIQSAVVGPDGRLAFNKARGDIGDPRPTVEWLAVAPGLDPSTAAEVQRIPYTLPGELPVSGVSSLRWQSPTELIYVGGLATVRTPCQDCTPDTITTGFKVTLLDLGQAGAGPVALPGTDFASGVARGDTDDQLYFTLSGDSRVYRRTRSSGQTDVAFDFGPAGVARDIAVAGGRLAAVVGGRVHFQVDPLLGPVQFDSGGVLHVVDLGTGGDVALDGGLRLFRRPALAPTGDRVVAEGYAVIITPIPLTPFRDTTVARESDLYLLTAP
jgi:hypothetical protein